MNNLINFQYYYNKHKEINSIIELIDIKKYYDFDLIIDNLIKHKQYKKDINGEVPTPISVIEKLLDKLEEYEPDIYKKKYKYFDHSAGIGIFFICLYKRLIRYHTHDDIINNMLYMSEIDSTNCYYLRQIFGKDINLYNGDTLSLKPEIKWKINKFDIIMGNPPYNSGVCISNKNSRISRTKGIKINWPLFVLYSLKYLKQYGWFINISPISWLKINNIIHDKLFKRQIYYLETYMDFYTRKIFDVTIHITASIIKNTKNNNQNFITEKVCNDRHGDKYYDKIILNPNYNIPLFNDKFFIKILNICNKYGTIKYNNYNKKYVEGIKIYSPSLDNISQNKCYAIETYTKSKGYLYKEINKEKYKDIDIINKPKLILCHKSSLKYGYIDSGKYGISGRNNFYILNDNINDLKIIKKYLEFNIFEMFNKSLKYNDNYVDNLIWNYIPDILKIENYDKLTEDDFYNLCSFTEEEKEYINSYHY